jgi:hypothetical protein
MQNWDSYSDDAGYVALLGGFDLITRKELADDSKDLGSFTFRIKNSEQSVLMDWP